MTNNSNFDICIPTYNSLEYLKLCVHAINTYSSFKHHIIVHDNASEDGTLDWLQEHNIQHTQSKTNLGFCGVNHALKQSKANHVMIMNTDMFPLPEWDMPILKQINYFERNNIKSYTISSCLIEPTGYNMEYDIVNFGHDASTFNETKLVTHFKNNKPQFLRRRDTIQYSHPILLPRDTLIKSHYLDIEYFPGYAIDHDIAARAYYYADCRNFVMLGQSRVYHFGSKTFEKLPADIRAKHGEDIFEDKWGHSVHSFRYNLKVGRPYYNRASYA